jgi:hypothetical protein
VRQPDFDFEAANNFLAVLARLRTTEIQLPDSEMWVATTGERFCVSKAATELLCKAAQNFEAYELALRDAQTKVAKISEQAIAKSVQGSPGEAVRALLVAGAETLNAKLIELAGMVLNRHRERIDNVDETADMIEELRAKFCKGGTQVNLGHSSGRSAGSLSLRTKQNEESAESPAEKAKAPEPAGDTPLSQREISKLVELAQLPPEPDRDQVMAEAAEFDFDADAESVNELVALIDASAEGPSSSSFTNDGHVSHTGADTTALPIPDNLYAKISGDALG